jgi:hypothetical protein
VLKWLIMIDGVYKHVCTCEVPWFPCTNETSHFTRHMHHVCKSPRTHRRQAAGCVRARAAAAAGWSACCWQRVRALICLSAEQRTLFAWAQISNALLVTGACASSKSHRVFHYLRFCARRVRTIWGRRFFVAINWAIIGAALFVRLIYSRGQRGRPRTAVGPLVGRRRRRWWRRRSRPIDLLQLLPLLPQLSTRAPPARPTLANMHPNKSTGWTQLFAVGADATRTHSNTLLTWHAIRPQKGCQLATQVEMAVRG